MASSVPTSAQTAAFWTWFQAHEERLFALDLEDEDKMEAILDEITGELARIHPDLVCEFSSIQKGKRELVISADGLRDAFPAVEALVDSAPKLPRWTLFKFRQRRQPINELQMNRTLIQPEEVECAIVADDKKVAVLVFIPKVKDAIQRKQFGFIFLDEALGEYDVETKVSAIEIVPFDQLRDYPRFPLPELPARFDELYGQLNAGGK